MTTILDDLIQSVLDQHSRLELDHADGDAGRFLSGWQCENSWAEELAQKVYAERNTIRGDEYQYIEEDEPILESLRAFHVKIDGTLTQNILPALSSTQLLFAYCMHLQSIGVAEVFYIPPLYYTFHAALQLFGIRARPISARHAYEVGFTLNLPNRRSILLLSDPTWYSGTAITATTIEKLGKWQQETSSQIFVDGSFQYMRWSAGENEPTSKLAPELTARIICPTKILAMHSYRFAYLLAPPLLCRSMASKISVVGGSSPGESIALGRVAAREMLQGAIPRRLIEEIKKRHADLRARERIRCEWMPSSGYFVFEQLVGSVSISTPLMDGSYFEQPRFPDHRRINLLSPSISLLD